MTDVHPPSWGVAESYRDYRGRSRPASAETIARILDVLGADGRPPDSTIEVVTGSPTAGRTVREIEMEDGGRERVVRGRFPADLPLGYHRLIHTDGSTSSLIVSPGSCYLRPALKVWGWAVQLYAARSRHSWGIGDLHDLHQIARWSRSAGAGVLLINPLSAVAPGIPQEPSPYFPTSRCFLNPLYLRIEDVPGAMDAPVKLERLTAQGHALNTHPMIDRDAVYSTKMDALNLLWERFHGSPEFDHYRGARGGLLEDFATYSALCERYGSDRAAWPRGLETPASSGVGPWRRANGRRVLFHQWLQWLLDDQLSATQREIELVNDLPIGIDPGGADAWIWQHAFARGVEVGAPPDEFNLSGQGWGVSPFDPWKLRTAGYAPFIETIRAAFRHGAALRIDHVMGLFRLFWIPLGMSPAEGTYVRYPATDLLNILALESHRAGAYVIGEDLGTVEPIVRKEMAKRDMLSYRVMWFEESSPRAYPERALATVTNHDLPTVAGVWTGADLEERERLHRPVDVEGARAQRERLKKRLGVANDASIEEVIEGAYRLLAEAPSMVKIATLEDAVCARHSPNIAGTTGERRNWAMGLPLPIEEIETAAQPARIAAALSGRPPCGDTPPTELS